MSLFKLFTLPDLAAELRNILINSMGIGTTKNHMQLSKAMLLPQKNVKNYNLKPPDPLYSLIFLMILAHVIHMPFVCHLYVNRMY